MDSKLIDKLSKRFVIKLATKSYGEKFDEQADKLVKPLPKDNPPRHDRKNRTMEVDEDKDLKGGTAETDKDLSLNYKKVGAELKRNVGDIWKTNKGWSVKLEDKNIRQAPTQEKAKEILENFRGSKDKEESNEGSFVKIDENGDYLGVDFDNPAIKKLSDDYSKDMVNLAFFMKQIVDGKKLDVPSSLSKSKAYKDLHGLPITPENKLLVKSLLTAEGSPYKELLDSWGKINKPSDKKDKPTKNTEDSKPVSDSFSEELSNYFDGLDEDPSFQEYFEGIDNKEDLFKSFEKTYNEVISQIESNGITPNILSNCTKALEGKNFDGQGTYLAWGVVAKKIIANPLFMGGNYSSAGSLSDKAIESNNYYKSLSSSLRQEAMKQINTLLENVEEGSNQNKEINSLADGLFFASTINGDFDSNDDIDCYRSPPSLGLTSILKTFSEKGEGDNLLNLVSTSSRGLSDPQVKERLKESLLEMNDDDFYEACGGEDGPDSKTIELLKSGDLSPKEKKYFKQMLMDGVLDSSTSYSELLYDIQKEKELDKETKDYVKTIQEFSKEDNQEELLRHDESDLDWGSSLLEENKDVETSIREEFDEHKVNLIKCLSKTKDPSERWKCNNRFLSSISKVASEKSIDWSSNLNSYRLNFAKAYLRKIEDKFGVLPDNNLLKAKINHSLKNNDAIYLDEIYVSEGENVNFN